MVREQLDLLGCTYEFVSSRKTDHGDLPDKALLFNYAIFNSSENFERESYRLTRGYSNNYKISDSLKIDILKPFDNVIMCATSEGCGYYGVKQSEHDVVVEHIRPGVGRRVMIGVGAVREDVGEGLLGVLVKGALVQRAAVRADLPDLEVCRAVDLMLVRRDELQAAVVVEVCNGVVPGAAVVLLEGIQLRLDEAQLRVDVGRIRPGCAASADGQREQHCRRQQKAQ